MRHCDLASDRFYDRPIYDVYAVKNGQLSCTLIILLKCIFSDGLRNTQKVLEMHSSVFTICGLTAWNNSALVAKAIFYTCQHTQIRILLQAGVVREGGEGGKWKEREGVKVTPCVSVNSP